MLGALAAGGGGGPVEAAAYHAAGEARAVEAGAGVALTWNQTGTIPFSKNTNTLGALLVNFSGIKTNKLLVPNPSEAGSKTL